MSKKMSLTREQKQDLEKLGQYFEKIEKLAAKSNIDLDVFITEYKEEGYSVYATEKVELERAGKKRKRVFEKSANMVTTRATNKS